jgi:hypothetical protein
VPSDAVHRLKFLTHAPANMLVLRIQQRGV